jgi:hypothetical protein
MVERVDLGVAHTYEIQTQLNSGGVTIDLEIAGSNANGAPAWVLWSEHKVNDPLTAGQLENEWKRATAPSWLSSLQADGGHPVRPNPGAPFRSH